MHILSVEVHLLQAVIVEAIQRRAVIERIVLFLLAVTCTWHRSKGLERDTISTALHLETVVVVLGGGGPEQVIDAVLIASAEVEQFHGKRDGHIVVLREEDV